jgi:hypothetical protein
MIAFIDGHRDDYGVEPICRVLPIAPSTFHAAAARRRRPEDAPPRIRRDAEPKPQILRVFNENFGVYGVRKVWRQMLREGFDIARCTVERLMKAMGIVGVIRGKTHRTTFSDKSAPCPLDKVNRDFKAPAPNRLWVSDFTYVSTWGGFVYVAFHHRRVRPAHRRLACEPHGACRLCSRGARTGAARSQTGQRRRPRVSFRSRQPVCLDQI